MTTADQHPPATRPSHRPRYQVLAEVALTIVTLSVVIGFGRVFNDGSYLLPLATIVIATHLYLAVVRRRGWGIALTGLVGLAGLAILITDLFFWSSTKVGIPTASTLTQVGDALQASYNTFQNVTAPAPVEPGFMVACAVALFFAAYLSDWAAFRLWSPWEAIVPSTTLFVFCSLLGSTVGRIPATTVFVAAALSFILVHSVAKRETAAGWLSSDVDRGSRALLRVGAVLGLVAIVVGLVVGPHLPGADSDPVWCWNKCAEGAKTGDRFTVSPLVEIQTRLIQDANVEMFTVESPQKAYWRMTSLDTFDGNTWRSKGKFTVADGDLDSPQPPTDLTTLDQKYHIEALARLWIPAAFQPVFVSEDARARFQSDSATLIVDTDLNVSDGLNYEVKSKIPNFTPDQLRGADTSIPADIADHYLGLPDDFSVKAASAAKQETAGQRSSYDKAIALQSWFRNNFTYSLQVPSGHSDRAIDDFLDHKVGYCEQFAGTFAAMARSLGIPARVAVGFTWGDQDPSDPNLYHVKGENAHAWPELYLGQYGWVPFEPTPGRGNPFGTSYTNVPEQQFSAGQDASSTSSSTSTAPPSTVAPPPTTSPTSPLDLGQLPSLDTTSDNAPKSFWQRVQDQERNGLLALATVVLVTGVVLGVLALLRRRRRQRRRDAAHDPSARVQVAWQESMEDLATVGVARVETETNDEYAHRASREVPEAGTVITGLARDADAAMYAHDLLDDAAVTRARDGASTIAVAVRDRTSAPRRFVRAVDPFPDRTARRRRTSRRHRATSTHESH